MMHQSFLTANSASQFLCNTYEKINNAHAPLQIKTKKCNSFNNQPWTNKTIFNLRRKKQKSFRKWMKDTTSTRKHKIYKEARNNYTKAVTLAKQESVSLLLANSRNNAQLMWKNINKVINYKNKSSAQINQILNDQGKFLYDSISISNEFNNYFVSVGENLAKSIPNVSINFQQPSAFSTSCSFFLRPITSSELMMIINKMNIRKSAPSTCGSIELLKLAAPKLCPVLCKLFNRCLS